MAVILVIYFALIGVMIAGMWKTFDKAGEPGWAAIVPIYNVVVMAKVAQKEAIWVVVALLFGIVGIPVLCIGIAERFGKGAAFGIGMAFLPFIFWPILGFGDAQDENARRTRGRRRSRDRDYGDYDDEDDRPRKKKPARYEEDEDEDDRPRSKRRREVVDEDEDEERPRKRRRDDDEDEDDRPARRRRRDDD